MIKKTEGVKKVDPETQQVALQVHNFILGYSARSQNANIGQRYADALRECLAQPDSAPLVTGSSSFVNMISRNFSPTDSGVDVAAARRTGLFDGGGSGIKLNVRTIMKALPSKAVTDYIKLYPAQDASKPQKPKEEPEDDPKNNIPSMSPDEVRAAAHKFFAIITQQARQQQVNGRRDIVTALIAALDQREAAQFVEPSDEISEFILDNYLGPALGTLIRAGIIVPSASYMDKCDITATEFKDAVTPGGLKSIVEDGFRINVNLLMQNQDIVASVERAKAKREENAAREGPG